MRSSVRVLFVCLLVSLSVLTAPAQPGTTQVAVAQSFTSDDPVIRMIWDEGVERSQIYELGQVMMDLIGPRLTGSPGMARANDWSVAQVHGMGHRGIQGAVRDMAWMGAGDQPCRFDFPARTIVRGHGGRVESRD